MTIHTHYGETAPASAPLTQTTKSPKTREKTAKTRSSTRARRKMLSKTAPNTQQEQAAKGSNSEIAQELQALAELQTILVELENKLSQGQGKISTKLAEDTAKRAHEAIQKIQAAEKKMEEAKKKQKQMHTLGIVISVFACALSAFIGPEAFLAVAAMTILQQSGAFNEATDKMHMNQKQKLAFSLGVGAGFALLTGGASAATFADSAADGALDGAAVAADGAADDALAEERTLMEKFYDFFQQSEPTSQSEAFQQGARFGGVTGAMGALTGTGVLQQTFSKLCGKNEKGEITSMILMIAAAMMAVALAGSPGSGTGGALTQLEESAEAAEASANSVILKSLMRAAKASAGVLKSTLSSGKVLAGTALTGASLAEGTINLQLSETNKEQSKIAAAQAEIQQNVSLLKFSTTLLNHLEQMIQQSLSGYSKNFQTSAKNLNTAASIPWAVTANILRSTAA